MPTLEAMSGAINILFEEMQSLHKDFLAAPPAAYKIRLEIARQQNGIAKTLEKFYKLGLTDRKPPEPDKT